MEGPNVDFVLQNEGSICILVPMTKAAQLWIDENIPDDAQRWVSGVVIEHRYVQDIINGLIAEGYTVRG
jgi:poly(3-hydroxyalkanoate) synthetase